MPEEDLHLSDQTRFQAHQPSLRDCRIHSHHSRALKRTAKLKSRYAAGERQPCCIQKLG